MPRDKNESHKRINQVAKEEFLAKGFMGTSMREIGQRVGMSQAALYRHYPSKEAMFSSLVEPVIEAIKEKAHNHIEASMDNVRNNIKSDELFKNNEVGIVRELIKDYRDELKLIICCSQGTKYEYFIHNLVMVEQEKMLEALDFINSMGIKTRHVSKNELHMLLSAYITALFEPIEHDWSNEEINDGLDLVEEFFIPGWKKIMGF